MEGHQVPLDTDYEERCRLNFIYTTKRNDNWKKTLHLIPLGMISLEIIPLRKEIHHFIIPWVFRKSSEHTTKLAAPSQIPDAVPLIIISYKINNLIVQVASV
jgi:hypothetical protein